VTWYAAIGSCWRNRRPLDANQLAENTKHYLHKDEVKAVMARRDKIVALFEKLIPEKGEEEVLY
jgi:hypothetical protein